MWRIMKADSYFEIGATHLVCQDYALAYADDEFAYAIISDGCTSSPNTDIGARLISIIARDALVYLNQRRPIEMTDITILRELVVKKCLEVKGSLSLPVDAFDATLLIAFSYKDYPPYLLAWGDGNFIIKYKDGVVRTISISYDKSMPYYLSYQMSHAKDLAYRDQQQEGEIHIVQNLYDFPTNDTRIGSPGWESTSSDYPPYLCVIHRLEEWTDKDKGISQIVVSSDGLQSFQFDPKSDEYLKNDKVFPLSDIYPGIINYKNLIGEFAVRRMKSLEKENRTKHIIHYDDVSCAAIVLD
jgi:hypothetical protein